MSLDRCTLTGVDETTPLVELAVVSDLYPYAEWAFLYSPRQQGTPGRYPSVRRIERAFRELPPYVRVALHVCGDGVVQLLDDEPVVSGLVSQVRIRGGRVQLNFSVTGGTIDLGRLRAFVLERPDLVFITQHNRGNALATQALAGVPNHAVLFDESLGRGILPRAWPAPLPSVACGYAGGLGPESLPQQLPRIYEAAGGAPFWIDMEARLRDEHDRFSMPFARTCLEIVSAEASERLDVPAPRQLRRQCEPIELIDSGLMRSDVEREFELMLRQMVHATRDSLDPNVTEARRRAESLLRRKGTISVQREEPVMPQPAKPHLRPQ